MFFFVISTVGLISGFLLANPIKSQPQALFTLHGFLQFFVTGLVLFEMIPVSIEHIGWVSTLLLFTTGWMGITFTERMTSDPNQYGLLAGLALGFHALLDGALLADDHGLDGVAWAIVLHRLPMGMLIAWLCPRRFISIPVLLVIVICTGLGIGLASTLAIDSLFYLVSIGGGGLIHIIHSHSPILGSNVPPKNWIRLGMILAILVLGILAADHPPHAAPPLLWVLFSAGVFIWLLVNPSATHDHMKDFSPAPPL